VHPQRVEHTRGLWSSSSTAKEAMMPSAGQDIVQEWDTLEDGYFSPVDVRVLCKEVLEERESMRRTLAEKHERVGLLRFSRPQSTGSTGPSQTTHAYVAIGGLGQLIYVRETTLDGPETCQQQWERVQNLMVDMETLRSLEHPNVVSYFGATLTESSVCVLTELCSGGSLTTVLRRYEALDQNLARKFTSQILEGLLYLHKHGITHRDLNLSNCLLHTNGNVKLSNVGESRFLGTSTMPSFAKTLYCPPEVFHGLPCGRQADIWSLGACVVEMYEPSDPNTPFSHLYYQELATMKEAPTPPDTCCEMSKSFINSCRTIDPLERPNALFLREHPFVAGWRTHPTSDSGANGLRQRTRSHNAGDSSPTSKNPRTTRGWEGSGEDALDTPVSQVHCLVEDSTEDAHKGSEGALSPSVSRPQMSLSSASGYHKSLMPTLPIRSFSSEETWGTAATMESSDVRISKKGTKKAATLSESQLNTFLGVFRNPVLESIYVSQLHQAQYKLCMYMYPYMQTAAAVMCIYDILRWLWSADADDHQRAALRAKAVMATIPVLVPVYILKISKKKTDPEWVMNSMCIFQDVVTYPYIFCVGLRERPMFSIARITFLSVAYVINGANSSRLYTIFWYYFLLVFVYNMWNAYICLSISPENVTALLSLFLPEFAVSFLSNSAHRLIPDTVYSLDYSGVSHVLSQWLSDPDTPASLTLQELHSMLSSKFQAVMVIVIWLSAGAFISNRMQAYNRLVWLIENMDKVKEAEKAVGDLQPEVD